VWAAGKLLHPKVFVSERGKPVYDDHMPFLEAKHQYVNIIDFDYPYWHTTSDTADKVSPRSLERIGKTVSTWLEQTPP
jgi:Zn-dependent M28 family amino/carboxypeptidase